MPKWARFSTTSNVPLLDRMSVAFEGGSGEPGPLAKVLARGGCFALIIFAFIGTIGVLCGFVFGLYMAVHHFF